MAEKHACGSPEAALTRLMQNYEKEVVKLCFLYLHDLTLAEDAAQETFLKAYRAWNRFRGDCAEKTWLMRIAINTCKDVRRTAWHRLVDRRVALEKLPPPAEPPREENVLITLEVMNLPAREREAVLLRCYQGMTVNETAQALRISPTAVSKRLKKAFDRLRSLGEGGGEND